MPFRSEAQRRKFYAMARRGEISADTLKKWEDETPKSKKLPERIGMKKTSSSAKLLVVPAMGATGTAVGYGGRRESERWRGWKGDDGKVILVRSPKTKKAFDQKMALSLAATGADLDKVAAAYAEELEKIAFLGGLIGRGMTAAGKAVAPKGWRAAAGLADDTMRARLSRGLQSQGQVMTDRATGYARFAPDPKPKTPPSPKPTAPAGTPKTAPTATTAPTSAAPTTAAPTSAAPTTAAPATTPAAGGDMFDQARSATNRARSAVAPTMENLFGVNTRQGLSQFQGGVGNWFGDLTQAQQRNVVGALGAGAGATGLAAGFFNDTATTEIYT
jgi:hypothetical protein